MSHDPLQRTGQASDQATERGRAGARPRTGWADLTESDLQAAGRSMVTQRSYAMDLLRWFRFLWAVEVSWREATRVEARDFCRWLALCDKPMRGQRSVRTGTRNLVTGKPTSAATYAPATRAHCETVVRGFYAFHQEAGSGPMVNPFPLVGERRGQRAHAHHNPMEPWRQERSGRYRPLLAQRVPRSIPDDRFNQLFAELGSHRDRALVSSWVSTGARAAALLGVRCGDIDAGQQLVAVVRKGSRAMQPLPASPDAFVWLRLYQCTLDASVPTGRDDPVWWTLRSPRRPLTYHAAWAMFTRANQVLGANCSPGPSCCSWTAKWQPPNRRSCATGCCTSPPGSHARLAGPGYASPRAGHGPPTWSPRSPVWPPYPDRPPEPRPSLPTPRPG